MKKFEELSKRELSQLDYEQIEAYVDVELAARGIVKPLEVDINYPEYLKEADIAPERDVTVYEVDGYVFKDQETATKFAQFLGSLPQVQKDYDWSVGSEFAYVKDVGYTTPTVEIQRVYSEPKYQANKVRLKSIKDARAARREAKSGAVEQVIDYAAIDEVRSDMKTTIRQAVHFFAEAEKAAQDYDKYQRITDNHEKTFSTLFTVYNIQDDELKDEIRSIVARKTDASV